MLPFDIDIIVLLIVSLFFSLLYEVSAEGSFTWSGIVGSITWIILSLVFFVARASSGLPTYIIGLFFNGIGIFYVVRWMIELLNIGRNQRSLGEVET